MIKYLQKKLHLIFAFFENKFENFSPIKKRRRRKKIRHILVLFFYVILLYVIVVIIACFFYLSSFSTVLSASLKGKANLDVAIANIKSEQYTDAKEAAIRAQGQFLIAQKEMNFIHSSKILDQLPILSYEIEELYNLISGVEVLSRALTQGIIFIAGLRSDLDLGGHSNYATFTTLEKSKIISRVYQSGPELNGLRANLELASIYFNRLNLNGVLLPFKYKLLEIRKNVDLGVKTLNIAVPLSEILPLLAGHPNKSTMLVLMQNQDELRPTGGFIGTYGILETDEGDINRFETHDVYHLDMPVQKLVNVVPPDPIEKYLNKKWYFRDSNWSPDWPTTSRKVQDFYHLENNLLTGKNQINNFNGTFTGVMAISPNMIIRLLDVVGSVNIGKDVYDSKNFSKLLEYKVEKGYMAEGKPSWQRKEVIGDIVKQMKIKLFDLSLEKFPEMIAAIDQGLTSRDLLFYFNNPVAQKAITAKGWSGEIKNTSSDYIFYVDANMASLKTDAVISREFDYKIDKISGVSMLKVRYNHEQAVTDWRTSAYKTYARLYVPLGTTLIKVEGARTEPITLIEKQRTNFGVLINVEPGTSKEVTFYYKIPKAIIDGDYNLYVQKQPNSRVKKFKIDVIAKDKVKSLSQILFNNASSRDNVIEKSPLTEDAFFQFNK
ncbi:MAG: DUF4012 domain-containing protein [bacterium]